MKLRIKVISMLLILAILIGIIPMNILQATNEVASGNCGIKGADDSSVTWVLDNTGTLTISGTGAMANYEWKASPFYKNSEITKVIINEGVISVGSFAFDSCSELTSVIIPKGVTSIEEGAFDFCSNLTSVTIPTSVETIKEGAFWSCAKLTSVTIPNSVTSIEERAFGFCSGLTGIIIPDGVTSIEFSTFYGCSGLTNITIPENVETIGAMAFLGCSGLTSITIPKDITSIGNMAFESCSTDLKILGHYNSTAQTYSKANNLIFKTLLEDKFVSNIDTQYYSGTEVKPDVSISIDETPLTETTDYTVSYENNNGAGTGKVIITGTGDYSGKIEKTFAIEKQQYSLKINPLKGATVTPSDTIKVDYDGSQNYTIKANDGYKITSILVNVKEKIDSLKENVLTLTKVTENTEITVVTETIVYEFIEGQDAKYNNADMQFKLNGLYDLFDKLYVNGTELSKDNYTVTKGSTIINLKNNYLSKLNAGTYTLKATYTTGASDETTFVVEEKKNTDNNQDNTADTNKTQDTTIDITPKTGDNIILFVGALLIAMLGTAIVIIKKNKIGKTSKH